MVWRKADNWTAFTDGTTTWINGAFGLASRLNSQIFEWEKPPAPAAAAPQQPAPGLVLYQANWASDAGGWPDVMGWSVRNGMMANDGSSQVISAMAPYRLDGLSNFAVEADIQLFNMPQYGIFGILVLDRYLAGVQSANHSNTRRATIGALSGSWIQKLQERDWDPGIGWHTYRVEVRNVNVKLLVDGVLMDDYTDNSLTPPGQVGLFDNATQINMRSFKIVAL